MKRFISLLALVLVISNIEGHNKTVHPQAKIVDYFPPEPHFPGGQKSWNKFLVKNLKWPNGIDGQGKVVIGFTVEKNGVLTGIRVVKKVSPEFDDEALRVVRLSPHWIPATLNGKPIRCKFYIPIDFRIAD